MTFAHLLKRASKAAEASPLLTLAVLAGVGALIAFVLRLQGPPPVVVRLTPVVESVLRDAGTPRAGAADADVIVVVFTDYRCPICRRTDAALERLLAADPRVRVHFKDWPILGEASRLGAQAALAAQRQDKYLALHRALMSDPRLLMLDEPSLGLAPATVELMYETLERLHAEGLTILLAEQSIELALEFADRAYVLQVGKTAMAGKASDLANDPEVQRVYLGMG